MALLEILYFPDSRLRKVAKEVTHFDPELDTFVSHMLETMYVAPGIGLAATQVNRHERIIVIDVSEDKDEPLVIINPVIVSKTGEGEMDEGCLSIPDQFVKIKRAESVTIRYQDVKGHKCELTTEGLLAVCIQHEMDHLEGKLFVDYLSKLKRNRIRRKLEKIKQQSAVANVL